MGSIDGAPREHLGSIKGAEARNGPWCGSNAAVASLADDHVSFKALGHYINNRPTDLAQAVVPSEQRRLLRSGFHKRGMVLYGELTEDLHEQRRMTSSVQSSHEDIGSELQK